MYINKSTGMLATVTMHRDTDYKGKHVFLLENILKCTKNPHQHVIK